MARRACRATQMGIDLSSNLPRGHPYSVNEAVIVFLIMEIFRYTDIRQFNQFDSELEDITKILLMEVVYKFEYKTG